MRDSSCPVIAIIMGRFVARDAVFVNPGSISLARDRSGGTFAIVTYDNGQFDVEFVYKQDIV